jgi:hypothetical protein
LPEILQEIGAYAGMASVVGLAVLSALYFSQARDVKRLREWAGRAPERSEQGTPALPGRVTPPTAAPPPVPGPGKTVTPIPGRPAPATPAGQTAPAAAAAAGAKPATAQQSKPTEVPVPAGQSANAGAAAASGAKPGSGEAPAAAPSGAGGSAPAAGEAHGAGQPGAPAEQKPAAATAAAAAGGAPSAAEAGAPAGKQPAGQQPAASAGPAAPSSPASPGAGPSSPASPASAGGAAPASPAPGAPRPPAPQPPRPAVSTPPRRPAATPAGGRGSERFASRPGVTSRHSPQETAILPPRPKQGGRLGARYLAIVLAGLLVLGGAAAYGVSQLTGDDGGGNGGQSAADTGKNGSGERTHKPGGAVKPASVTVAVLNGTTVPGLAATLSDEVGAAGFKVGTITNFSDQQLAESVVQYAPGHQAEARAVSRRLGIAQREPVNPSSQALAGDATVIVIAGADKAP